MSQDCIDYISREDYSSLLAKESLTFQEGLTLASYPFISLPRYCKASHVDNEPLWAIQDASIFKFLRLTGLVFGVASEQDLAAFHRSLKSEPLMSAITLARREKTPEDQYIKFTTLAIKILLSIGNKGTDLTNPINIQVDGKLPITLFYLKSVANQWFEEFINQKMEGMEKIYKSLGPEQAYKFILNSTAHSVAFYNPDKYSSCLRYDYNETLQSILKKLASS